jgi:hypothetical protein
MPYLYVILTAFLIGVVNQVRDHGLLTDNKRLYWGAVVAQSTIGGILAAEVFLL